MGENTEIAGSLLAPDSFRHYILGLFDQDINHSTGFDPLSEQYTPLFASVYDYCLDQGVKHKAVIDNPQITNQEIAPPVAILSRTGLIYYAEQHGVENYNYHRLDIAQMRQADLAGAGDWLLNKISQVLKQVSGDNLVARYGGDEFMIMTPKKMEPERVNKLFQEIKAGLAQLTGYFCDPDNPAIIREKAVRIKNDQIETLSPPQSEPELSIFKSLMSRGIMLSQQEINRIKNRPGFSPEKLLQDYWQTDSLYPESLLLLPPEALVKEKVNYLTRVYPEFTPALQLTQMLDQRVSQLKPLPLFNRTEATLRFIENVIFDRRLKDVFYSFQHLTRGTAQGRYLEFFAFDCKFLKELNDHYSYLEGDELIASVWQELRSKLGADREAFNIARRGGTFLLALKTDRELPAETRRQLEAITHITGHLDGKPLTIPVGVALREVDRPVSSDPHWIRQQLSVVESADKNWYKNALLLEQGRLLPLVAEDPFLDLKRLYLQDPRRGVDRQRKWSQALAEDKI